MIDVVRLDDAAGVLVILDQTRLPGETVFLPLASQKEIWEAIRELRVRGAPAIGIAAAYGAYLGVRGSEARTHAELCREFARVKKYLATARPTAVNLFWALDRMEARLAQAKGSTPAEAKEALKAEAEAIRAEDEQVCRSIGEHSLTLLAERLGPSHALQRRRPGHEPMGHRHRGNVPGRGARIRLQGLCR